MMSFIKLSLISMLLLHQTHGHTHEIRRQQILRAERKISVGGNIVLTEDENKVNNCLMQHKFKEIDIGFNNPRYYNFSQHFFKYKDNIRNSKVYQIIKDLPKGAALHVHDTAILGADYWMNKTYMDHLYVCFQTDKVSLWFSGKVPNKPCTKNWILMSEARRLSNDVKKFDANLRKHFTMVVDNPAHVYPSITDTWRVFSKFFGMVFPIITYKPLFEQYVYDVLTAFREDNIMYVELRSSFPQLYELNGTTYDHINAARAYKKAISKFVNDYPDFIGGKIIFAPARKITAAELELHIQDAGRIKEKEPNIFAGLDLVGREDMGTPLIEFVPELTAAANNLTYFFHAGETDWYGTSTDENLVDAILLNPKRIGHAYALPKHPLLVKEVMKREIGLEVSVISNAVLSLVQDVRNHPLALFLAQGLPVVISSDDPGAWEADPISDDFYVAFAGVASRWADLKMLKQLAINSLTYSALDSHEKTAAVVKFHSKWDDFVKRFNCSSY